MKKFIFALGLLISGWAFGGLPQVAEIVLEGVYTNHLQDVWYDGKTSIYWAHTGDLVKTDLSGKILVRKHVGGHHAGIEGRQGRLYCAVCAYNGEPRGETTPECHVMIGEYDAETLEQIAMHVLDINDRAGSLAILADGTFLVGCLRPGNIRADQVRFHHIGRDFKLIETRVLDNVPVRLGIETIKRIGDRLFLNMYGVPNTVRLDLKFQETGRGALGGDLGMVLDGTELWVGKSKKVGSSRSGSLYVSKLVRTTLSAPQRQLLSDRN